MPRDDAELIELVSAAEKVARFVSGLDKPAFLADGKTQSAVCFEIAVIGETAKKLSEEFKNRHAEIPWRSMARMRDLLIHHSAVINPDEVWDVAVRDVPDLLTKLRPLLPPKDT